SSATAGKDSVERYPGIVTVADHGRAVRDDAYAHTLLGRGLDHPGEGIAAFERQLGLLLLTGQLWRCPVEDGAVNCDLGRQPRAARAIAAEDRRPSAEATAGDIMEVPHDDGAEVGQQRTGFVAVVRVE